MTLGEKALDYLGRGWCVIPCATRGKKPLVDWQKWITQRPTPEQVREWWNQWPDANIAVVTGRVSGLVVVDVDTTRGADPAKVFEQYPTGLAARTGSGGAHLFYSYPPNAEHVNNRVGKDGIDIRADGGYVIVAPSIHPNGHPYEFVNEDAPTEMPEWVVAPPVEVEDENKDKWLSELLDGCEKGGRNNAAARIAGYFAAKGMAYGIAWTLLQQWNARNDPPMPKGELKTTLSSVYKTAARNGTLERARKAQSDEDIENSGVFEAMDFRSYMTKFGDIAVTWQIQDWIPTQTIAFVVSPPGSYKTWLTFDLALSVASGRPFLGQFPVKDAGPVLLIQQEDFHGQIAERLANIASAKFGLGVPDPVAFKDSDDIMVEMPPDLPIFVHTERRLRFADTETMAALGELIAKIKPKLVIIDPLYSAGSTDDFMAKTAEQMFVLKRLRDEHGCSFVVVHHTKKSTDKDKESNGPQRESLWGSQFLNAFLETGWQIRRTDDPHAVAIKRHFKVKSDSDMLRLTFDISTEYPHKYEVLCEEIDETEEKADLIAVLERLGPSTAQDVAKEVGLHRSSVSRRLAKLVDAGAVVKMKDGRFAPSGAPTF